MNLQNEYDYSKFLQILKETQGINNSLNQIIKYDFIKLNMDMF